MGRPTGNRKNGEEGDEDEPENRSAGCEEERGYEVDEDEATGERVRDLPPRASRNAALGWPFANHEVARRNLHGNRFRFGLGAPVESVEQPPASGSPAS